MTEAATALPDVPVPAELPGGPVNNELPKPVLVGPQEKDTEIETLSLDELFACKDVKYETFTVDGWPKPVTFGSLTSGEVSDWMEERDRPGDDQKQRREIAGYILFAKSWIQPDGKRIPEERIKIVAELLRQKSAKGIDGCIDRIMRMNAIHVGNDAVKNVSSGTTLAASRSNWQHTSVKST